MAICLLIPAVPGAAQAVESVCSVRKVEAIAATCSRLLRHEGRIVFQGGTPAVERRLASIQDRFLQAWSEAEADDTGECAAQTASAESAWTLLGERIAGVLGRAPTPVCQRRLARTLSRACRSWATMVWPDSERLEDMATRHAQRLDRRVEKRWSRSDCPSPAASTVQDLARGLGGFAAGLGTQRSIADLATAAGVRFGAAIEPGEVAGDETYASLVAREANSLTAENVMKWGPIHPQEDVWNFAPADAVVSRASANSMRLRGHTLVWGGSQIASYVQNISDRDSMLERMEDHIEGVVGRYAGQIEQWDVVNEPLPSVVDPPTSDGLDDNVFRRVVGSDYIARAFHFAHAADPDALLFLNDNGILLPGARQDRFVALVEELLADGVPLHGIGVQGHIGLTPPAAYPTRQEVAASIRRFADLGLLVEITELDVVTLFLSTEGNALPLPLQQAVLYSDVVGACLENASCTGITTWGLGDHLSWVRTFFGLPDDPLLFLEDWTRKPAYFAVRAEFAAAERRQRPR